jgi:cathepsin L
MYAITIETLANVSEQNLVDCDLEDDGCNGGNALNAWDYVLFYQNGNFVTETSYPYTAHDGSCNYNGAVKSTYLTDYGWLANPTENNLLEVVAEYGPVACAIDASHISFQEYATGIYYEEACSSTNLDHEVLTIGWGIDSGNAYWIVKNSWGTGWGENGYIRMSRNKNNNCGIASDTGVPLID